MDRRWRQGAAVVLFGAFAGHIWAGGSGLNVLIVVNQNSTNSVQLGNYYAEKRQVPPQNFLRINWAGGNIDWTESQFNSTLRDPITAKLSASPFSNQVDYIVLSMDIPFQITADPNAPNSTTSALFYGMKYDTNPPCSMAPGSTNLYACTEAVFRSTPPISPTSNSWLAMMITASNLAQAMQTVDSGVLSDSSFPTQTVLLTKTSDPARNVRYLLFDNTIFDTRLRGNYSVLRTNLNSPTGQTNLLGCQTGLIFYNVLLNSFIPGAMADSLTSYGGLLFESSGQDSLLGFISAGAAGSYGTVTEPCNYLEKFPSPQAYFFQSRGFSLAECYYQSITNPYQGLLVGEPLAAPFAAPASGAWTVPGAGAILHGTTNLAVQFNAPDAAHPVQQIDLFVDGSWAQTLTNVAPARSNILTVRINGFATNFAVPSGATVASVTSNLAARLNAPAYSALTKVSAFTHGDRIQLRSSDTTKLGTQLSVSTSNSIGSASALTTFLSASGANFLDTTAYGTRSYTVGGMLAVGDFLHLLVTKTNGAQVAVNLTNTSPSQTIDQFVQQLVDAVNATNALQGGDGLVAEDFAQVDMMTWGFNLRALTQGLAASGIQANLSGSLMISPTGTHTIAENLADLQPRNHLYVTSGVTNLPVNFAFNTTNFADGYHVLEAVAYEGSHVRVQKRVAQNVRIQNSALGATFSTLFGGSNTDVSATLQFSVVANTSNIAKIELFATGGSLGSVAGVSSALFQVAGTNLGVGLHPFYAVVTPTTGQQYRTETLWIRLLGPEPPFNLTISGQPTAIGWTATAGRSYDILTTTDFANGYQTSASVIPSNSVGIWTDTNPPAAQRFFRVRTSH